jgi:hypothetical protein
MLPESEIQKKLLTPAAPIAMKMMIVRYDLNPATALETRLS